MSVAVVRTILAGALLTAAAVVAAVIVWLPSAGPGVAENEPAGGGAAASATAPAAGPFTKALFDDNDDGEVDRIVDLTTVSAAQAAALADGYVTRQEYEGAVRAEWQCIVDAGYDPLGEPSWDASGTGLRFAFGSGSGIVQASRDCRGHHSELVRTTWSWQNRPSPEQTAAGEAAMLECLIVGGLPEAEVRAAGSFEQFVGRGEGGLFGRCIREVSEEFGLGWSGN